MPDTSEQAKRAWEIVKGRSVGELERHGFFAGFAAAQRGDAERDEWIRGAYDFIERVLTWTGSDPDEIHELLQSVPEDRPLAALSNQEKP